MHDFKQWLLLNGLHVKKYASTRRVLGSGEKESKNWECRRQEKARTQAERTSSAVFVVDAAGW